MTPVSPPASVELVKARRRLELLAVQLRSTSPGPPEVSHLIDQLRQLVALTLAASPAGPLPAPPATLGLLTSRVGRLSRLLVHLCHVSRSAARHLAPALPALRSLWRHLFRERRGLIARSVPGLQPDGGVRIWAVPRLGAALQASRAALLIVPLSENRTASVPDEPESVSMASEIQRAPRRALPVPAVARLSLRTATAPLLRVSSQATVPALRVPLLAAGGVVGSAGGAGSAGASGGPALTVTTLTLALLFGLLAGRIDLDRTTLSSALLGRRLERPG